MVMDWREYLIVRGCTWETAAYAEAKAIEERIMTSVEGITKHNLRATLRV
jgi:hypothetical protein